MSASCVCDKYKFDGCAKFIRAMEGGNVNILMQKLIHIMNIYIMEMLMYLVTVEHLHHVIL